LIVNDYAVRVKGEKLAGNITPAFGGAEAQSFFIYPASVFHGIVPCEFILSEVEGHSSSFGSLGINPPPFPKVLCFLNSPRPGGDVN
jgi:hypothetical protein